MTEEQNPETSQNEWPSSNRAGQNKGRILILAGLTIIGLLALLLMILYFVQTVTANEYFENNELHITVKCTNTTIRVNASGIGMGTQTLMDVSPRQDPFETVATYIVSTKVFNLTSCDTGNIKSLFDDKPTKKDLGDLFTTSSNVWLSDIKGFINNNILPSANLSGQNREDLIRCQGDLKLRESDISNQRAEISKCQQDNQQLNEDKKDQNTNLLLSIGLNAIMALWIITDGGKMVRRWIKI